MLKSLLSFQSVNQTRFTGNQPRVDTFHVDGTIIRGNQFYNTLEESLPLERLLQRTYSLEQQDLNT